MCFCINAFSENFYKIFTRAVREPPLQFFILAKKFCGVVNLDKMQEEAMRRVREMQSANPHNRNQNRKPQENEVREGVGKQEPEKTMPTLTSAPTPSDPLAGLFKDKEKLLILLLIMLLSQENSNTELVLALLYIII